MAGWLDAKYRRSNESRGVKRTMTDFCKLFCCLLLFFFVSLHFVWMHLES